MPFFPAEYACNASGNTEHDSIGIPQVVLLSLAHLVIRALEPLWYRLIIQHAIV
jgi:hypothetical protein